MLQCSNCNTPLHNAVDTFGDVHLPLCEECFFEITADEPRFNYYTWQCINRSAMHYAPQMGVAGYFQPLPLFIHPKDAA